MIAEKASSLNRKNTPASWQLGAMVADEVLCFVTGITAQPRYIHLPHALVDEHLCDAAQLVELADRATWPAADPDLPQTPTKE